MMPAHSLTAVLRRRFAATLAVTVRMATLTAAVLLAAAPRPGQGQDLLPGLMPQEVTVTIVDRGYAVSGNSAREILDQMRGSGWVRGSYRYQYTYRNERLPTALNMGTPSTNCRSIDLEMTLSATAIYPKWTRPSNPDPELVAAWEAYSGQLDSWWEASRSELARRLREVTREVRRTEEHCSLINRRIRSLVAEQLDRPWQSRGDPVSLQWPPQGFENLLSSVSAPVAERPGPDAPGESAASGPQRPDPERIDEGPVVTPLLDIDLAVSRDLEGRGATGLVLALDHLDNPQFQEAFGTASRGTDVPLEADAAFEFPAFTEVLIATLASSLSDAGEVNLHAPVADYLPDLTPELGRATLRQLLDHRAGLDNAQVPDTADWTEVLDDLDDRALFTVPGAVFSHSRYSYPLARRVLETVTGTPLDAAVAEHVLGPLGLDRTSVDPPGSDTEREGLPATRTTAGELTRFWTAWLAGEIAGSGPEYLDAGWTETPGEYDRRFALGVWYDIVGEAARLSLMCGSSPTGHASGFQVFPETRTIFVFWANYEAATEGGSNPPPSSQRWPKQSVLSVLSRIADALGTRDQIYRPTLLTGGAEPTPSVRRCAEPAASSYRVRDFGPYAPVDDWVGQYMNGEWFFELVEHEGRLASPVDPSRAPYSVRHYRGDVHFTDLDIPGAPSIGFPFRLLKDEAGRRYVVLGERAYLHTDDRER